MEAIVLAGGFGTRLRQVLSDLPKPMAPVAGRPFLEIVLSMLAQSGFERAILSLGYMAEIIRSHFGLRFEGLALDYEIEERPLGTGGATRAAMQRCTRDHAFIFNGDTYLELQVTALEAAWQASHRPIIVAREVRETTRYGRLKTEGNLVKAFQEKGLGGPGLINAGCYVLPRTALDAFPFGQSFSLEVDYLAPTVLLQPVEFHVTHGRFIDIGIPEDYARAQSELAHLGW